MNSLKIVNSILAHGGQFVSAQLPFSVLKRMSSFQVVTGTEGCSTPHSRGLVLGVYSDELDRADHGILTRVAANYDKRITDGSLLNLLRIAGPMPRRGECRIFYDLEPNIAAVAVCGLGDKCLGYNWQEQLDESKEAIRIAAATGCRALQSLDTNKIFVEDFGDAESAAEGAAMGLWRYQELKALPNREYMPQFQLHVEPDMPCDVDGWSVGMAKAEAQNLARKLMETPANVMSPTRFAQNVVSVLCDSGVSVEVKVREWAEAQRMSSFLALAQGSSEPPIFLELTYYGTKHDRPPVVLVGQGLTYNSGGVNLKSKLELADMRGDICGAACVVAACRAIAAMRLPLNIRGLVPLCEHMIGCEAMRPGDILKSQNGKCIEVERTDHAAVLALNDALLYAKTFKPEFIIDVGSISADVNDTFGQACSAVFTNSDELWCDLESAGVHTGDRLWRMPLWDYFRQQITSSPNVDLQNVGTGRGGGACKAAAFLNEFVRDEKWIHIDAQSVMTTNGNDFPYLKCGMAGRPTRTLIEFIAKTLCKGEQELTKSQTARAESFCKMIK